MMKICKWETPIGKMKLKTDEVTNDFVGQAWINKMRNNSKKTLVS